MHSWLELVLDTLALRYKYWGIRFSARYEFALRYEQHWDIRFSAWYEFIACDFCLVFVFDVCVVFVLCMGVLIYLALEYVQLLQWWRGHALLRWHLSA